MTRTRWACLVIAAVSLAVIAMCVLDRTAEPDRAPPADTPPPDTVRTGARAETVEQIERGARVPVEAEPDPARLVVRVQDRTGGPVAGATVSRVPATAQWLSAEGRRRVPLDGSTTVTWSTDDAGNLTIKVNGVNVADLPNAGFAESGSGWEGGGAVAVDWVNLDFAQPE